MNRQRALVIKAANTASRLALRAHRALRPGGATQITELGSVRRRLEILLAALYGHAIRIEADAPPRRLNWLGRLASGRPRNSGERVETGVNDGSIIRLPRAIKDSDTIGGAVTHYRLLAVEHAERIARNTAALVPADDKPLERDLYLLAESAAIDRTITHTLGGLADLIRVNRQSALARRPALKNLSVTEQQVEIVAQTVLSSSPEALPAEFGPLTAATDSLAWARETAAKIRERARGGSSRYRGIAPVPLWGRVRGGATPAAAKTDEQKMLDAMNAAAMLDTHIALEDRASENGSGSANDSSAEGSSETADDSAPGAGDASDAISDTANPDSDASLDELQDPVQSGVGTGVRGLSSSLSPGPTADTPDAASIVYPEWDCNAGEYRPQGATVRTIDAPEESMTWVDETLATHSVLIRRVRRRFEMLRARRVQLPRQRDGDELDLAACVRAIVDLRTGHSADDRLYVATRPARRDIAITILVDVSGSTADPVTDTLRVIDVEKIALLLASEAIDALGDAYSIVAFSSHGALDVRATSVKGFSERNGERVQRRIAALTPQGKTRLGAAVRHVTAQLVSEPVGHRLLLILSDGRPNDTDRYFETYAAEDTRRAILEARALDVFPFCITVDRSDEAEEYLSHIFGAAGHTILRQADQLPLALLKGVQQLLGS